MLPANPHFLARLHLILNHLATFFNRVNPGKHFPAGGNHEQGVVEIPEKFNLFYEVSRRLKIGITRM